MGYDFSELDDKEFEQISCDLLSIVFQKPIETFKQGKDGGIDGRFFSDSGEKVAIQCKLYIKTPFSTLIRKLKNEELKKIKVSKPSRYILVVSMPLSLSNKNTIKEALAPFIKSPSDIYGLEDLNRLLGDSPKIEEKYFKLWIKSTTVLKKMLNNGIDSRSKAYISQIIAKAHKLTQTQDYFNLVEQLEMKKILILTGDPGVGKTTLAGILLLFFIYKGYDFYLIDESIHEIESIYDSTRKQIFYFDDFLGSNYLEAIDGDRKNSQINNFIDRVKSDSNQIFILSSRINIIQQAYSRSKYLQREKIGEYEYEMKVQKLSHWDRAKILYSHICCSRLFENHPDLKKDLYINRNYLKIIYHENYNPRIIEFITSTDKFEGNYWDFIQDALDNPSEVWSHYFAVQNDVFLQYIILIVTFHKHIPEKNLQEAFYKLINFDNQRTQDFATTLKLAVGSLIIKNIDIQTKNVSYSLFNPSIADYLFRFYRNDCRKLTHLIKSINSIEGVKKLKLLFKSGIVNLQDYQNIIHNIIDLLETDIDDIEFMLEILACSDVDMSYKKQKYISEILDNRLQDLIGAKNIIHFLPQLLNDSYCPSIEALESIIKSSIGLASNQGDLIVIWKYISFFKIQDFLIETSFDDRCFDCCLDDLQDEAGSVSIGDYDQNENLIFDVIQDIARDIISDYSDKIGYSINIDSHDLTKMIDIETLIGDYNRNLYNDDYDDYSYHSVENQKSRSDIIKYFETKGTK